MFFDFLRICLLDKTVKFLIYLVYFVLSPLVIFGSNDASAERLVTLDKLLQGKKRAVM